MNEEKNQNLQKGELTTNVMCESGLDILRDKPAKFCTLDLTDKNEQIKLYNSLQQCDAKLIDLKGQTLTIIGAYVERRDNIERDDAGKEIVDSETGEVKTKTKFRTILFGNDGKTYVSTAFGIFNSLNTIASIFGMPSVENPLNVRVLGKQLANGRGESLILLVVNENE